MRGETRTSAARSTRSGRIITPTSKVQEIQQAVRKKTPKPIAAVVECFVDMTEVQPPAVKKLKGSEGQGKTTVAVLPEPRPSRNRKQPSVHKDFVMEPVVKKTAATASRSTRTAVQPKDSEVVPQAIEPEPTIPAPTSRARRGRPAKVTQVSIASFFAKETIALHTIIEKEASPGKPVVDKEIVEKATKRTTGRRKGVAVASAKDQVVEQLKKAEVEKAKSVKISLDRGENAQSNSYFRTKRGNTNLFYFLGYFIS